MTRKRLHQNKTAPDDGSLVDAKVIYRWNRNSAIRFDIQHRVDLALQFRGSLRTRFPSLLQPQAPFGRRAIQ